MLFSTLNGYTPTPDTLEAYNYFKSQEGPFDQTNRATAGLAKIDFNFSNGDRMTFKYNISDSNEVNAVTVGGASGGTFNPANYSVAYASGVLTVTPAPLTITANSNTLKNTVRTKP